METEKKKRRRKRFFLLGCMVILTLVISLQTFAAVKNGFVTENGKTYYYENGTKVKGWLKLDGKKYYFDTKTGVQLKGWQYNAKGEKIRYFTLGKGVMATGWLVNTKGEKRYFDPSTGKMTKGWLTLGEDTYYFYTGTGIMATGWLENSKGQKRYFSKSTGRMLTGWLVSTSGVIRYMNPKNGIMQTGLKKIGGNIYFFNKKTGAAYTEGFRTVSGSVYYFGSDGKAVIGWLTLDGSRYYFGTDGIMYADIVTTVDGKTYRFEKDGKASGAASGDLVISGNNVLVTDPVRGTQFSMMKAYATDPAVSDRELLAAVCDSEAGDQGLIGMEAVALCVLNRTLDPEFPSQVRMVVYEGTTYPQYSVVTDGSLARRLGADYDGKAQALKAADAALSIFQNYVSKGKKRTLEGFDRADFNFVFFMTPSSFNGFLNSGSLTSKCDYYQYKDHVFFVYWR